MYRICYVSEASGGDDADQDLATILDTSRRNNARDAVTGLLLADGRRFLQALEGPEPLVRACMDRIARDPRHDRVTPVDAQPVAQRQFGDWAMIARRFDDRAITDDAFAQTVRDDVAEVTDASLRALFIGFAALARRRVA